MKKIPLSKRKHALVSDEDFERLAQLRWYASLDSRGTKWYAIRWRRVNGKQVKCRMHHAVLEVTPGTCALPPGYVVDHKDNNSLNNTRENLEIVTQAENMLRSAGWKKKGMKCST